MAEQAGAARIRLAAEEQLRKDFPYLNTAALEELLDQITLVAEVGLKKRARAMRRSKARISFFSLPAELRNEI
ncbi:hypothetical protein CLAFUW4_08978 [Fulvia fulva]|uniref:Uncharacterized protein n=1 Tax=Passalora fulva TaxID=5499 RepID=A0A9Q8PFI7_PASFU|nr:uncharacterized protein CLAFUR5_09087 [Fulvia fulva]KAK4613310.1 hypothetical protein CLAFUR4_08984 [Fulvia fulva]KAK4614333.1 hypothetical protein CLAFUR0_08976 [Fulvia fulva]UJO21499.1 hypothetical protein CLAFUR5_09087 [Fulvia fulva]WPV20178.1 hypothetical protein CLAFUW4_08978 [Fulvia fulva]WPV35219.1 hypothetical protein CLAFUW7_08979 [Fulvia fulva]